MAQPTELEIDSPPCPLCSEGVQGYESFAGLAYISEHGGPFGGTGTYLVAGGDKPPAGIQYDRMQGIPWLSKIVMKPCGCALRGEGFKMLATNDGKVFRIEGEEWFNPL